MSGILAIAENFHSIGHLLGSAFTEPFTFWGQSNAQPPYHRHPEEHVGADARLANLRAATAQFERRRQELERGRRDLLQAERPGEAECAQHLQNQHTDEDMEDHLREDERLAALRARMRDHEWRLQHRTNALQEALQAERTGESEERTRQSHPGLEQLQETLFRSPDREWASEQLSSAHFVEEVASPLEESPLVQPQDDCHSSEDRSFSCILLLIWAE
jgi:hypothetical protein